jgi:hypothetical protein
MGIDLNPFDEEAEDSGLFDFLRGVAITSMATNEGRAGKFQFYIYDREPTDHHPHVHVQVKDLGLYKRGKRIRRVEVGQLFAG